MKSKALSRSRAAIVRPCGLGLLCLLVAGSAWALETDQYYTWGRPLADSTDVVNAKFNLELQRAIDSFQQPPDACVDISVRFRKRMRFVLFHHVQLWALHSSLVAKIPADAEDDRRYRQTNLYSHHPLIDPGTWMPYTPTIEIDGVRLGTDKLSHLVSSGWTYYSTYRKALENGRTEAEAGRAAVRRGILEEKFILGAAASGIVSLADIESSYQGLHFYRDLCDREDPILIRSNEGWVVSRPVDLRDYVHPRWDESYQPSVFTTSRWSRVRPQLSQYCDRRGDPEVVDRLSRYRRTDRRTTVAVVVDELVAAGELDDPEQFSLDTNCPDPPPTAPDPIEAAPAETSRAPSATRHQLTEAIIESEQDTRRKIVPMVALRLTYPQVASLSYGLLLTRLPSEADCFRACDMWGPFAQLEPGLGGGKLSLGWGRVIGERRHGPAYLSAVYLALGIKGTVLRSWGNHTGVPSGQTYAGPEFEFSVARVNMGIGVLGRISGDQGRDWIVTGLLGWGF